MTKKIYTVKDIGKRVFDRKRNIKCKVLKICSDGRPLLSSYESRNTRGKRYCGETYIAEVVFLIVL